jgi:hypothetical protein
VKPKRYFLNVDISQFGPEVWNNYSNKLLDIFLLCDLTVLYFKRNWQAFQPSSLPLLTHLVLCRYWNMSASTFKCVFLNLLDCNTFTEVIFPDLVILNNTWILPVVTELISKPLKTPIVIQTGILDYDTVSSFKWVPMFEMNVQPKCTDGWNTAVEMCIQSVGVHVRDFTVTSWFEHSLLWKAEILCLTMAPLIKKMYFSFGLWRMSSSGMLLCKIWGFHGGDYDEWCLLGCYAVWLL